MDQLPQELLCQVCSHLSADDLCNTSYVSSRLRDAAADYAQKYKDTYLSYPGDVSSMEIECRGFRHRYIEYVEMKLAPPKMEAKDGEGCCHVSRDQQRGRDEVFTAQIQNLFTMLKAMEDRAGERNRGDYRLVICSVETAQNTCIHGNHPEWRTCLLEPEKLPQVKSVRSLKFNDNEAGIKYDYRVMIDLMAHLPNAGRLEAHVGVNEWTPCYTEEPATDFPWEYDGPRRDTRHGFGAAIMSGDGQKHLHHLQSLQLDFFCRQSMHQADRIHHSKAQPNLVSPAAKDPFSTSLRILSYHLRELDLRAQIDETLFWPADGNAFNPTWPHLQTVRIMFHMVSPSGAWYFAGPRGEGSDLLGYEVDYSAYPPNDDNDGDDDEVDCCREDEDRSFESTVDHQFRIHPNNTTMLLFLSSFAKAAINMPALRHATLYSPLRWTADCDENYYDDFEYFEPPEEFYPDYMAWGLEYCVPGEVSVFMTDPRVVNSSGRQIRWNVGEWRPDEETHGLFSEIGKREHGGDLEETWTDEKFGEGLVSRDYFEEWDMKE